MSFDHANVYASIHSSDQRFLKEVGNLHYMLAIYFAHYNFCRSHKKLNNATPGTAN